MIFGYARVSTNDQDLSLQLDALTKMSCHEIYQEKISGKTKERPELDKLLAKLRAGDTVAVWRLDRLGRSMNHLVNLILKFQETGICVKGITDGIDTSTSQGRLMFNIMSSLAEFERELIRERTRAGMAAAKVRGRTGGRPTGLVPDAISKIKTIRSLIDVGKNSKEIYQPLGLKKATYYRYVQLIEKHTDKEIEAMVIKKK